MYVPESGHGIYPIKLTGDNYTRSSIHYGSEMSFVIYVASSPPMDFFGLPYRIRSIDNPRQHSISWIQTSTDNDNFFDLIYRPFVEMEKSTYNLLRLLESEPFEVGIVHPADEIINSTLEKFPAHFFKEYFDFIYWRLINKPSALNSLIRSIGRQNVNLITPWVYDVLDKGLKHKDVEVRSASAFTLDKLGDKKAVDMLKKHVETVPWLENYINDVLSEY